jgi:hypothetical protein
VVNVARKKLEKKKISFNVPTALLEEIEDYCQKNTLPLTQGIHILIRFGLDYSLMIKSVPDMLKAVETIKELQESAQDEDETENG